MQAVRRSSGHNRTLLDEAALMTGLGAILIPDEMKKELRIASVLLCTAAMAMLAGCSKNDAPVPRLPFPGELKLQDAAIRTTQLAGGQAYANTCRPVSNWRRLGVECDTSGASVSALESAAVKDGWTHVEGERQPFTKDGMRMSIAVENYRTLVGVFKWLH